MLAVGHSFIVAIRNPGGRDGVGENPAEHQHPCLHARLPEGELERCPGVNPFDLLRLYYSVGRLFYSCFGRCLGTGYQQPVPEGLD